MKKKGLVYCSLGLATCLGIGVVAALTANKVAKDVRATPASSTIYLDLGSSKSYWEGKKESIYVHWWGSETASGGMTANEMEKNDFGLFTFDIPSDATGMVFSVAGWGGDCQTVDLTPDTSKTLWTLTSSHTDGTKQTASNQAYTEKTIYVLDKSATLLGTTRKAHVWKSGSSCGTTFPGIDMTPVSGRLYSVTIPAIEGIMVIFNNGSGSQTADLSIDGVCSVLESDWNGTKWVALESAQFIDGYMHFNNVSESDGTSGTANCATYYAAAKEAYNDLSNNATRLEVLSVSGVSARLSNWAEANHDVLDKVSGDPIEMERPIFTVNQQTNDGALIVTISAITLVAAGAAFAFLRRRKEQ